MLILDNILFNGDIIIKLRLQYLYPYIDKFFICEKRFTHQGKRKETLFFESCKDWFTPYKDKCVFLVDESNPSGNAWTDETHHRNYSASYIDAEYPEEKYLLICADVDEIPDIKVLMSDRESLYTLTTNAPMYMIQKMYYYNLFWFGHMWIHPFILSDIQFRKNKDIQSYRDKKVSELQSMKCGWHFSYFMTIEDIVRKIESFSHTEYNNSEYKAKDFIQDCLLFGQDLYRRDWIPPFTREVPEEQGYPPEFLDFHFHLLNEQFLTDG